MRNISEILRMVIKKGHVEWHFVSLNFNIKKIKLKEAKMCAEMIIYNEICHDCFVVQSTLSRFRMSQCYQYVPFSIMSTVLKDIANADYVTVSKIIFVLCDQQTNSKAHCFA